LVKYFERIWVCETCNSIYEHKDEAESCEQGHIEFKVEPKYVVGNKYPVLLLLKEYKGDNLTKIIEYIPR